MGQVQPVLAPLLAIPRAGQQAIDEPFVSVRPVILEERGGLGGCRWKAGKVEGDPADQGHAIGLGSRRPAHLLEH